MGDARRKIEEFINCIDTVLDVYDENWKLNEASETTVKSLFKLASTLETCYAQMKEMGCLDNAQDVVLKHWKQKGRTTPEDLSDFEEACDLILMACMRCSSIPFDSLRVAVVEYESYCGGERLKNLVIYLLRDGVSCALLHALAVAPPDVSSSVYLGWKTMLDCGQSDKVKSLISLSLMNSPDLVNTILELVKTSDDDCAELKSVVMNVIVSKMRGMTDSREFCVNVLNSTEVLVLVSVAQSNPEFLTALLESIQYLAADAEWICSCTADGHVDYQWHNLKFPLKLLQRLCVCDGPVGFRTRSWLAMLQERPGCTVWEDIATCIGI